jgi:NDP-sugar pyrophosphorylase family protein
MNEKSGEKIITRDSQSDLYSYSFSGIQIIEPKIFKYFPDKDVFSLVELYLLAAKKEKIIGYNHSEDEWMDLGKFENVNRAESLLEKIRNTYQV